MLPGRALRQAPQLQSGNRHHRINRLRRSLDNRL